MVEWRPRGLDAGFFEEEEESGGPEVRLLLDEDLEGA